MFRRSLVLAAALVGSMATSSHAITLTFSGTTSSNEFASVLFDIDDDRLTVPTVGIGSSFVNNITSVTATVGSQTETFDVNVPGTSTSSQIEVFNSPFEDNFSINTVSQEVGQSFRHAFVFGIGRNGGRQAFLPGEQVNDLNFVLQAFVDAANDPTSNLRVVFASTNVIDPVFGPLRQFATTNVNFSGELTDFTASLGQSVSPVPLPAALPMLGAALVGLGILKARRRSSKPA